MRNSRHTTSITDLIIEVAIPVLIIGLIWTLVVFVIAIKGVYYPGQERTLTRVFFLYVMGTVMINRIAGLYGETDKAAFYSILLISVMGLFALTFSARYGSILGGTNAGEGLLFNIIIVAVIGFASYKLARESCFDIEDTTHEKSAVQLRSELRAQRDWYRRMEYEEEQKKKKAEPPKEEPPSSPAKMPTKHPGIWIIYFSLFSMVVFAAGQRLLPADNYDMYLSTFSCLIANLVCALVLLALVTLSALRFHCWEKKAVIPGGLGPFWSMTGGVLILIVLSLASLPPRPVPEYITRSISEDYESMVMWEDDEDGVRSKSLETWGGQSKLINEKIEKEERDIPRVMGEMMDTLAGEDGGTGKEKKEDEAGTGRDEEDKAEEDAGAGKRDSAKSASGKGSSSRRSKKARAAKRGQARAQMKRPPLPTPPLAGLEKLGRLVIMVVLFFGFLWAAAMMFVAVGKANPLKRLGNTLRKLAGTLRDLVKRGEKPSISGRKLQAALEQENLYMQNPFASKSLLKQMSMAELVSYTYKAFENYAHVQGHTPLKGQTPVEFMESLPEEFRAPEFSALLNLFMVSEYSAHTISDKNVQKLRKVWAKIDG